MRRTEGTFPQEINLRAICEKLEDPDRKIHWSKPFTATSFTLQINKKRNTNSVSQETTKYNETILHLAEGDDHKDMS